MGINLDRLYKSLMKLGAIGFEDGKGTSRLAYSETFDEGRDYVKQLMEEAGLSTFIDSVGNLTGRLEGTKSQIISIGSHIDTVPGGGMFDGTLGVLAGIEVLRTLQEQGYENQHTFEVIAFTEEEGNVIGGTFGSKVFVGEKQEEDVLVKLKDYGLTIDDISSGRRSKDDYCGYLELHIEQGGILESKNIKIGVVEGIFGIVRYQVRIKGKANHAGSTPMYLRDDALKKACQAILKMMDIVAEIDETMTCTIGKIDIEPGAVNVIPGLAEFPIELRCMNTQHITEAITRFEREFKDWDMEVKRFIWQDETKMDEELKHIIRRSCEEQKIKYIDIPSGAGHDAINMAQFTPTAMIFIPSQGGISHSILENSSLEDIEQGANLLLDIMQRLDYKNQREEV